MDFYVLHNLHHLFPALMKHSVGILWCPHAQGQSQSTYNIIDTNLAGILLSHSFFFNSNTILVFLHSEILSRTARHFLVKRSPFYARTVDAHFCLNRLLPASAYHQTWLPVNSLLELNCESPAVGDSVEQEARQPSAGKVLVFHYFK